ncbi:hypothetical protein AS026_20265 [Rhizobium altiplani]|uniref:Uncharacterized protein n=1 Tax=Rhizobium altiplani TaxID=1864509 RepID=A0A109J5S1_9HYPH|nr:hypothetical protein AS026_20265 [Rhizobium altiplani]
MVLVADELKRKSAKIAAEIDDLRRRISALQQQRAAVDVVIQTYEPGCPRRVDRSLNLTLVGR